MNLLYCLPSLYNPGGMERVLTEKVNYLANLSDYEITIVTTDQGGRPIRFILDQRIKVVHLDIDFNRHYAYNLFQKYVLHKQKLIVYKKKLTGLIIELEVDICISLCGKEIEFLSKMSVGCKKIAEIHFGMNNRKQFLISRHKGIFWEYLGDIRIKQLQKSVKGLDKLVVLTKDDKLKWEKTQRNIIQIRNPNPLINKTISSLDSKRVISIGKLDPQKGYDMLIEAWSLVSKKYPDWTLDIFGTGEWKEMLSRRIIELCLSTNIILRGLTTDVVANYLDSSIYVMSSRFEGLPMVLIEAMSCGLPVISFDCECGPREIISEGVDGYLVETNNINALSDKICFMIGNDELRKEMGKNAFEKSKQFSIDKIMPKWVSLFEELMNK